MGLAQNIGSKLKVLGFAIKYIVEKVFVSKEL
jgi:hypothetical protein